MTSRALGKRIADLEAAAPMKSGCFCVVVHHEDCKRDREMAIADYVAKHGHQPEDFTNVFFISAQTKQSICGCPLAHERNQHGKLENAH